MAAVGRDRILLVLRGEGERAHVGAQPLKHAAGLARRGLRTLLVDLDPQACLTYANGVDPDILELSLHDVMIGRAQARDVLVKHGELHLLRTGKDVLRLRIEKLRAGNAWAEEPPSQTVRTISNIEVSPELEGLLVRSNVVLHRVRYTDDTEVHAASRADRLVSVDGAWRLAERRVRLAHGALRAANFQLFL